MSLGPRETPLPSFVAWGKLLSLLQLKFFIYEMRNGNIFDRLFCNIVCVCAHTCVAACTLICVIVHVCACHHITSPCTVGFSSPLLLWGSEDWTHIVRLGGRSPSLWAFLPVLVLYVRIRYHNRHKMLLSVPENVLCIRWSSYFSHFFFLRVLS